ncbi:DUF5677 domain-containing protein [Rubritalea sp.]|uniref:DUF5677 domain-containing protein n=1 Tax=Rubritalea sp. TaxID=2109375 RepID=UPI003EF28DEB
MRDLQSYIDEEYQKYPEEAMRLYDGKGSECIPDLLKSQWRDQWKNLQASRAATLRERTKYITNIQNGIQVFWGDGLNLLEQCIHLNLEWGTRLIKESNEVGTPGQEHLFSALIRNHSRACLIAEEVLHMLKGGFPDAAFSRWRSLHEIAITTAFLQQHGDACAEAYLEHEIVDHIKCCELDNELAELSGKKQIPVKEMQDLENALHSLLQKHGKAFKNGYGWAAKALDMKNPQFKDLEESVGDENMRLYYKQASHKVHAGANGSSSSLGTMRIKMKMNRAPSHEGLAAPAALCARSLIITTHAISLLFPSCESIVQGHILNELFQKIEESLTRASQRID